MLVQGRLRRWQLLSLHRRQVQSGCWLGRLHNVPILQRGDRLRNFLLHDDEEPGVRVQGRGGQVDERLLLPRLCCRQVQNRKRGRRVPDVSHLHLVHGAGDRLHGDNKPGVPVQSRVLQHEQCRHGLRRLRCGEVPVGRELRDMPQLRSGVNATGV